MTMQQKLYDPALMAGAANTLVCPQTITDSTNSAFAVGANGATNPVLQIDASTSSVATGVKITGAATGTACAIAAIGSGTDESLTIAPKGAGTVKVSGLKRNVVSGSGATVTLTKDQSGSVVLFDRAAGIVFTLPANTPGIYFDFFVTTTITSNAAKVITAAGTELLVGSITNVATDNSNAVTIQPSLVATGNVAVSMDGSTKGGIKGDWVRFTCLNTTTWGVQGMTSGTGTIASPFATS
jgi:hypothetical protein